MSARAMRSAVLLGAALLAACGLRAPKLFSSAVDIEVREVGRSLYCNNGSGEAAAVLLDDPQAVLDWQASRSITLAGGESLLQTPHAVVEMGARPTGGYGLAVARAATLSDGQVSLSATFVSPAPGSIQTQALSSPCVLVQLPPGRYTAVEVIDQTGAVRASGGRPQTAAPPGDVPAPAPDTPATGTPAR